MAPHKSIERQIEDSIDRDIDFWLEEREGEPIQIEMFEGE